MPRPYRIFNPNQTPPTRFPSPSSPHHLIRTLVQSHRPFDALLLFSQMLSSSIPPDNFTFPFALKACSDLSLLPLGSQIHSKALISGFGSNEYVQNNLISMYMNCSAKTDAAKVFDEMRTRTSVTWNTMISGYFSNGFAKDALAVFDRMVDDGSGVEIDRATMVSVLPACAFLKDLKRGRRVHELVEEEGFGGFVAVRNALIDMYGKCGSIDEARRVFEGGDGEKDVVSWTAMIGGCILNGCSTEALGLAYRMILSGIRPNCVTMASLLSGCGILQSVKHGKSIHGSCIRLGLESELIVETALIDMYLKCDDMVDLGLRLFVVGSRRTPTWNAVLSGLNQNGRARKCIEYFKQMLAENVSPDTVTIASLLPAYSSSADLQQTQNIHCYLTRMGFLRSIEATTGLIDAYAKGGCLDVAWELFDGLAVKDLVSWSAIIGGYGMHGHARASIWLLDQMVQSGVKPNEVTFTSVLYSCSHAGLVDEGLQLFERMVGVHKLRPHADHYACVVDLLGRAGKLEEAYGVIRSMPCEANYAVWGALLGACVIHQSVELGEVAAKHLFEIEPENTGNYVLLGKIYAAVGRWEDAEALRGMVIERGLTKEPGCSLLEVGNL